MPTLPFRETCFYSSEMVQVINIMSVKRLFQALSWPMNESWSLTLHEIMLYIPTLVAYVPKQKYRNHTFHVSFQGISNIITNI
jgi:hypothetical protein